MDGNELNIDRRGVLAGGAAVAAISGLAPNAAGAAPYQLAPLPYAYDALEPIIDRETMELHHGKHHQAYVNALNKALEPYPDLQAKSVEGLMRDLDTVPEPIRQTVRNQGGGHANHQLFWKIIRPGGATTPDPTLAKAIDASFGSLDAFKAKFEDAGVKQFGSGWVWLVTKPGGDGLEIMATPNQDSPLSMKRSALFGNDVWEHAYYLKHRNRRADYLKGWWNAVNWTEVGTRYDAIRSSNEASVDGPAK